MIVTASSVKELREITGAGMMDCKTALVEAQGDLVVAERKLKEQGLAAAAKRVGRAADQGRVFVEVTEDSAAMIELTSETDFVARNEQFVELGNSLINYVLKHDLSQPDEHMEQEIGDVAARIRENIGFKRCVVFPIDAARGEHVAAYLHGEGAIGVMVKLLVEGREVDDQVRAIAHDLALHVAAFAPRFLRKEDVDSAYRDEQEAIFRAQAEALGKPEKVTEGIVLGKLGKHLAEICLLEQGFVRDEKQKVKQVVSDMGKDLGQPVTITDFSYFKIGE